jgi:hypothetical protein
MKILKHIYIALLLLVMAGMTSSCEKYFNDVNEDPNRPSDVPPPVLLPSAQAFYAYGVGGDVSRFTSLLVNQLQGIDRQFATYQLYSITETDTDNWWKFNHYGGAMFDLYDIIQKAEAGDMPEYAGVAKIMMAYGLMVATDMLGDVPYDEAFQGTDNLTPTYNSQEEIYARIQTLLTEGKANLAETGAGVEPGAEDMIYAGDLTRWTMFANVLSARAYLHLGKRDAGNYSLALTALGTEGVESFGSSADDAIFLFGVDETQAAPYYQFNSQRGDIAYVGFLHDTMATMGDPRAAVYTDGAGGLGAFFGDANAPFYFASYMEQKFIEAEAAFQTGDLIRAATAHNAGVMASLARYGIVDLVFEGLYASETAVTISLEKIMTQKYIAMFLDVEAFNDWRRTGIPALLPNPGNVTGDVIPRRLPYPQSERLFNGANCPCASAITTRVWWDN